MLPKRLGIILLNLGGPETLDDVKPFLLNLFRDPDILPVPGVFGLREVIARLIVRMRLKHVTQHYAEIGGGSPLRRLTEAQGNALAERLQSETGGTVIARAGMRYWKPFLEDTMKEFRNENIRDVFLLPLYPQYSIATSGSSLKEWKRLHNALGGNVFYVHSTKDYHCDERYLRALSSTIDEGVARFAPEERSSLRILFSAHGLPESIIRAGDPYQQQILATVAGVMDLRGRDYPQLVSYQSRVGPSKWLKPYTIDTLKELGRTGTKNLLVVPVAFVSDHIETLHELNIELRKVAEDAGITHYEVTPGLNNRPDFIEALAGIVRSRYV